MSSECEGPWRIEPCSDSNLVSIWSVSPLFAEGSYVIEDGWFDKEDLESCVLSATRIHKRARDELPTKSSTTS